MPGMASIAIPPEMLARASRRRPLRKNWVPVVMEAMVEVLMWDVG